MSERVLPPGTTYEEVYARFRWSVPAAFNIGVDMVIAMRATPRASR